MSTHKPATASARLARKMLLAARKLGLDAEEVARVSGLASMALDEPDARVPHEAIARLWIEMAERTGDEHLGLHLAELARRMPDNVLAYAVQSCATLEEALRCSFRYMRLIDEALEAGLLLDGETARLRFSVRPGQPWTRHGLEFTLATAALFARECALNRFVITRVSFAHPAPRSDGEHRRVFLDAALRFEAPHHELEFPRRQLALPPPQADTALRAHLDRYLRDLETALSQGDDVIAQVRRTIGSDLGAGLPDMKRVAEKLSMSSRNLQRKLQLAGTTFQSILDETRHQLALRYLGEPQTSLTEVGFLVGFAESSTFYRAFKRWTGLTPAEARRRRLAVGG